MRTFPGEKTVSSSKYNGLIFKLVLMPMGERERPSHHTDSVMFDYMEKMDSSKMEGGKKPEELFRS